jgi:predicted ABC-type ATPase
VNGQKKRPEIVVFAGPNGSGKTTFTEVLRPLMDYINADEIKKNLKCSDLAAAQLAEQQREAHLAKRQDFCFETVMSTDRNLQLLQKAKQAGYFIRCYYVLTADPKINVYRVKARVAAGGHDVPETKIYERFQRAMILVPEVVAISDICHIYDNSEATAFRIFKKRKDVCYYDGCADWQLEDIQTLTGMMDLQHKALNSPSD